MEHVRLQTEMLHEHANNIADINVSIERQLIGPGTCSDLRVTELLIFSEHNVQAVEIPKHNDTKELRRTLLTIMMFGI